MKNKISLHDRKVALEVLKDIPHRMRENTNIFGGEELAISKTDFEYIRHKWLDKSYKPEEDL